MTNRLEFFHNFEGFLRVWVVDVDDPERRYIYGIVFEIFQIERFQIL